MSDHTNCIFCRIVRGELPAEIVWEDEKAVVFRDINPAAPVHLLAVPRTHASRLSECGEADADLLSGVMLAAAAAAKQQGLTSFRLILNDGAEAGQTVFHLHAHILGGRQLTEKLL